MKEVVERLFHQTDALLIAGCCMLLTTAVKSESLSAQPLTALYSLVVQLE